MAGLHRQPAVRPFSVSGYEILDDDLETRGEVVIWSVDPLTPSLGQLLSIVSGERVHDIAIVETRTFVGGWAVTGRVVETY